MRNLSQHIILIWTVPSLASIQKNRVKVNMLKKAIHNRNAARIITIKEEVLNFRRIESEDGWFFGLTGLAGNTKKNQININGIKSITLI